MDKKIFIIPLILISSVFCISFISAEWIPNFELNSSIPAANYTKPTVFNISNDYYMIRGLGNGFSDGFSWNGTDWVSNSTITTGLGDVGQFATPEILIIGDTINLVVGEATGLFYVFSWNGTQWAANSTLRNGLHIWDIGDFSQPVILGNSSNLLTGTKIGVVYGQSWNGVSWSYNPNLTEGLVDYGNNQIKLMDFYYDNQYLIVFNGASGFKNFNGHIWNGTQWLNNTFILQGLDVPYTQGLYEGTIFEMNGTNYMLVANSSGEYFAFEWFINPYELTDCKTSGWETGQTYNVMNDINAWDSCFVFDAENITLNLNGHTITGAGADNATGINSNGYNISILNGTIRDFDTGIILTNVKNSTIKDITSTSNDRYGFNIGTGNNYNNFINVVCTSNQYGFYGSNSWNYNYFENVTSIGSTGGIWFYGSTGNILNNVTLGGSVGLVSSNSAGNTFNNFRLVNGEARIDYGGNNNFTNSSGYFVLRDTNENYFNNASSNIAFRYTSTNNILYNLNTTSLYNTSGPWTDITGNKLIYNNTEGTIDITLTGSVTTTAGQSTDLGNNIIIENNYAFLNSSRIIGLNIPANITFYNMPQNFSNPAILRDGVVCEDCVAYTSLNAETVIFEVQGWSEYEIGEQPSIPFPAEADEGHRGTSEGTFISVPSTTTGADIFGTVGTNRTNLSNYIDLSKLEDIDGKEVLSNLREWFRTNQWAYVIVGMLLIGGLISLLNRK